jgi:hypothetical protein
MGEKEEQKSNVKLEGEDYYTLPPMLKGILTNAYYKSNISLLQLLTSDHSDYLS